VTRPGYGDRDVDLPTQLLAQPDALMLDLVANSREAALCSLHAQLAKSPAVKDAPQFLHGLLERAMLAPVCIAPDVALPHARTAAVERVVLGVARVAAPGVGFDAEHPNVRLIFMVGTPKQQVEEYLLAVAAITRLLKTEGVRTGLLAAKTEAEFAALLARGAKR
jgi:mannitol/fructose-specific phosphotransferase system IIA component (Ntr-type)